MTSDVVIADTGGANVASLRYAFDRLGATAYVTSDGADIASAERVVLPGVGAAAYTMNKLRAARLITVLRTLTQPVLGVCLGMQLLFQQSAEGSTQCLNLIPGIVHAIAPVLGRPIPHMGWNEIRRVKEDPLLEGIGDRQYAYFVHSYAAGLSEHTLATTEYDSPFSAVIRRGNFYGAQFHPERSGKTGARLLKNFLRL